MSNSNAGIAEALEAVGQRLQAMYGEHPIPHRELVKSTAEQAGCALSSVLPSDHAYNRVNRSSFSRSRPLFLQEGRGLYRFLGRDYPYSGPIYWQEAGGKERVVGHSKGGAVTFMHDPRSLT